MRKKNSRAIALVGAVPLDSSDHGHRWRGHLEWCKCRDANPRTHLWRKTGLQAVDVHALVRRRQRQLDRRDVVRWNDSSATGRGILRQNDCTPNCVSGKFINYRATVTLSKVVSTKKHGELFSVATFHYSVSGHAKTEVFDLVD